MNRKLKIILSIDGGGIRGMLPLVYLMEIERSLQEVDQRWTYPKLVDLLAGTSTGAVISAALTYSNDGNTPLFSPEGLLDLYKNRGKQVFNKERSAKRNEYPLKMLLEQSFGSIKLADFSKYFLFVSHDQKEDKPFIFSNGDERYREVRLSKALLACSAIKDYFPPVVLGNHELIDGIETAKNPAQLAFEYAKKYFANDVILLMSFGTGVVAKDKRDEIDNEAEEVHEILKKEAKDNHDFAYYRFQPKIQLANYDMDDTRPENLMNLYKDAANAMAQDADKIKEMVQLILANRGNGINQV
jgi:patatin-like phospholipase/acyl hydrolase